MVTVSAGQLTPAASGPLTGPHMSAAFPESLAVIGKLIAVAVEENSMQSGGAATDATGEWERGALTSTETRCRFNDFLPLVVVALAVAATNLF